MSETEKVATVDDLTGETRLQSLAIYRIIEWATISCRRTGCETAELAPGRLAGVVVPRAIGGEMVDRSLSWQGALKIADSFRACSGRCPVSKYCRLGWVPPEE